MIKLGWKACFENDPLGLLDLAFHADQAGFDFIDFCNPALAGGSPMRAATNWSWLGAAAVKTQQLLLGTCIPSSTFRRDPAVIAETLQTLAAISAKRIFLTVMVEGDESGLVQSWKDQDEQQAMLLEGIELIRALWCRDPVTYNSHYYTVRKDETQNQLDNPAPIYIALRQPGYAYAAGYHGDGMVAMSGMQPYVYRRILDEFAHGARDAGKDPGQMARMVELTVSYPLADEPELTPVQYSWDSEWLELEMAEDVVIPVTAEGKFRAYNASTAWSAYSSEDPNEHVSYAQTFIDLGFNHLLFHSPVSDSLEFIESYARDVLPHIRASNVS